VRVAYGGQETLTFMDYLDLGTGRTLRAEPGGVYDIAPTSGRRVDEVPAQWFTVVEGEPVPLPWAAEPDAVPEPAPEG
jgi:hypothetical protein